MLNFGDHKFFASHCRGSFKITDLFDNWTQIVYEHELECNNVTNL